MRTFLLLFVLCFLSSCYKTLRLEGFDTPKWKDAGKKCSEYRLTSVDLLIKNQELILESTQNEVESLLGAADEHELYARNQKFFHYRLTPSDSCDFDSHSLNFLSVRFNALGRASNVQVMIRERD